MGAWAIGPFDNDAAADWVGGLAAAIPNTFVSTFRPVIAIEFDLYLEEPEASEAIAAAEVVAAMRGYPGDAVRDRPEVLAWAEQHVEWASTDLVDEAVSAVERVQAASELRDLWAESEDFESWVAGLDDLLSRLRS
jgi:uncharacterized protein DUF4259